MNTRTRFLFGDTRSAVLRLLYLTPELSLHVREIARRTGTSAGSLHRELRTLAELGILVREESTRQVFYKANPDWPGSWALADLLHADNSARGGARKKASRR
jgi:DNA-binding transcriptional ArsR family regulator